MKTQYNLINNTISILMIITLLFTGFFLTPNFSFAAIKTETGVMDVTDLAYYDIWKHENGTWQNGKMQGSLVSQSYTITESLVPEGARIIGITGKFNGSYSGSFSIASVKDENSSVYSVEYEYLGQTKQESSAEINYTVSTVLTTNAGDNGVNIKEPWQTENVEGWRYYIPVVFTITYTYEVEIGDFEPGLDLPTYAKQGEEYTAADASLVDDNVTIDYAKLEKHYGDGNWQLVDTWGGTGLSGENTRGSISESSDEIGTITYRLTVYDTSGQSKSATKTITIIDGREINGQAILELPAFTYEGHPALAEDISEFEVDCVDYSARRAYEEGIAESRFRPLPIGSGSAERETLTKAKVTFPVRGNYTVRLEVDTADGKELTDTKPIEVRKTPYIIDNLGGFQKQNRKQILNISVATYPGKPITDYYIKLRDLKTGEEITMTKDNPQENNSTIKTREITNSGDQYWTNFELQFLTKTPAYDPDDPDAAQDFRYTIYMKDSKGDTDTVQRTFTVKPDLPPNAQITIADSFIRNKGTNIAEIRAEDSSTTDGDQLQRIWSVGGVNVKELPGYQDLSFGSGQKVQFNKTGVGKSSVRLDVKDIWTEPTLEEYITSADYLSAATTATTDVVNIAPTVRLEPMETETADIAIVTEKASESGIKAGINSLKAALLEAGIDANVQVIPTAKSNSDGYKRVGYYTWKSAINNQTQQSTGLVFGSEYAYAVEAAGFQISGNQEVAIPPYTVKALKKPETESSPLVTAWSYTVAESADFRLKTDSSENYVYLAFKDLGKTILLNRNNGAYVTTLPVVIPDNPYTTAGNNNLYFLNSGSIQKYDPDTGTIKNVVNKGGTLGRMQNGKLTFVGKESSHKFYIGQFDLKTETVTQKSIPELAEFKSVPDRWRLSSVNPNDLDTAGKVSFTQTLIDSGNDIRGVILWLADSEKQRVYNLGQVDSPWDLRTNSVGFVKDETGKAVYMYQGIHDDDSTITTTRKYFRLYVYTLGDGDTPPLKRTIYNQNNKRDNSNGISYAKYHSRENAIYLMQGATWQGQDWGGNAAGVNARIQLPSWTVNFNQYDWGWDIADEYGSYNDDLMMTYYNYDNWVNNEKRIRMFTNSITKEQAEESALTRLADFTQGTARYIEKNFSGVQDLIDRVKEAVKEKTSVKLAAAGGGRIGLSRSFQLKPGQIYYYEYEVKKPAADGEIPGKVNVDPPQITFDTKNVYGGTENLESYYVSGIIEEDFNGTLNPFFTLDSGRITDGLQTPTVLNSIIRNTSATSQISFTIPEGKTAVALMDVKGWNGSLATYDAGWKSGAYINGQRYDKTPGTDLNAIGYLHPYLLRSGVNTIAACAYDRTKTLNNQYVKIDNLKILFLEKTIPAFDSNFSAGQAEEGWTKVTGSFKTPESIAEFKSQKAPYTEWPPGRYSAEEWGDGTLMYYFKIPSGYAGRVFGTVTGSTSKSNRILGTFAIGNTGLIHRGSSTTDSLAYIHNGERWYFGDFQGDTNYSWPSGYGVAAASFTKMDTWVYPENLKGKTNFFFQNGNVYSISNIFGGSTTVKLNLNADGTDHDVLVQNLKVYYMNGNNKVYLYNKLLQDTSELSGWAVSENAAAEMYTEAKPEKEEDAPLVYKKGQLVSYNIFYDDYENDPSKKQYWRYTHTPYNDGPHPQAAFILDEDGSVVTSTGAILSQSIPRFYIDGKYTVEHWQEDNTNRTGDISGETDYSQYDKPSNVESITFYIEGGATAPWITSIRTIPGTVKEGDAYRLQIGVDDAEKDELRLTTELYKDKKLIYTHKQTGITADTNGNYPLTTTGLAPLAVPGKYEVISTVRDWSGAGIGTYKFTVVSEGKIEGFVNHTDQWDDNRKKYNLKRFGEEVNRPMQLGDYLAMSAPRMRGTNVFWSGERFMLRSETEGKPWKVDARIQFVNAQGNRKETGYSAVLSNTGRKTSAGEEIWEVTLWDRGMINKWGRKSPEPLFFLFTAYYNGGMTKTYEVMVIVDSRQDYWQLHRLW